MLKKLFVFFQYIISQHTLSRLVGYFANCRCRWFKNCLIRWFVWHYRVDMSIALKPDPKAYSMFNEFFIREIDLSKRKIGKSSQSIISPIDGKISQSGKIVQDQLIQAKGVSYSLEQLLHGIQAEKFINGEFITLYLSPRDYHRVHMPIQGELTSMHYIPGKLFSVGPITTEAISGLFAKNERLICFFNTEIGEIAIIMVGAMIVASINTVWSGKITPGRLKDIRHWEYPPGEMILNKADQMGHFELGSTVILLFPEKSIKWAKAFEAGSSIKMGEELAGF